MRSILVLPVFIGAAGLAALASPQSPPAVPAPRPAAGTPASRVEQDARKTAATAGSEPVLLIEGKPISADEYGLWLLRTQGEKLAVDFGRRYWVVDREARRLGVDVPDEEVERDVERAFLERIAGAFLGSRDDWRRELARTGRSEGGLHRQRLIETKAELQARNITALDRVVPEHVVLREWELRYGRHGRRPELQMILFKVVVPTLPGSTRDVWRAGRQKAMDEVEAKARAVRERALAGEDFGLLAAQYSEDVDTRMHRGAPSAYTHFGWPHVFLDAVEKLAPGEILQPTYARGGFWLVKLLSTKVTPLESVRAEITSDLIARGPEPYEIGMTQQRLAEGVEVRVLPSLYAPPAPDEFPSAWEPALLVDGEPVQRGEFARWLVDVQGEISAPDFVNEWMVLRKARDEGVDVTEAEVADRCRELVQERIDGGYKGDRQAWLTYLTLIGRSEDGYLRDLAWRTRVNLLAEKLLVRDRQITPEQVRSRWKELYGADGRRIEISLIVTDIQTPDPGPDLSREELAEAMRKASDEAKARIEKIAARLDAGEDFAKLAHECSDDQRTRDNGGEADERFHGDAWSDEIAAAVPKLAAGERTRPILWGHTWVIVKVRSIRDVSFEEAEKEILEELRTRRPYLGQVMSWRNVLSRDVKVEILPAMYR